MARGRKADLSSASNVVGFPQHDEPQAVHFARAKDMKPKRVLSKDESAIWDRVAPYLVMLGRLKPHFVDAFCDYCYIKAKIATARKDFKKSGEIYESLTRNGLQIKSRPEVAQYNDDWRKFRSLIGEFGLAPASDKGLSSNQGDLFDDFDY